MLKMSDQPPARYVGMPTRLHTNGLLREYFPKGTALSIHSVASGFDRRSRRTQTATRLRASFRSRITRRIQAIVDRRNTDCVHSWQQLVKRLPRKTLGWKRRQHGRLARHDPLARHRLPHLHWIKPTMWVIGSFTGCVRRASIERLMAYLTTRRG
ncbi:hypothetical protein NKH37_32355 [Mesorhizobium sp. M1217]|uniref:hypothetical protein n=1 Tax=Mesorhizobium sp. M1217 TaxID=2957070 RepID=UPI003337FA89